MPKRTKYPRLTALSRRNKNGKVRVYYYYYRRDLGHKDIPLGKDFDTAVKKWEELSETGTMRSGTIGEALDRWEEKELIKYESTETKNGYIKHLQKLKPVFANATWDDVDLPTLRQYLDLRTGKTQGNREMSLLSIIWHKALVWGMTKKPWPAQGVKNWKNAEQAREFEVTAELFAAVYAQGDQVLRDGMDIATATAMRLKDVADVDLPVNGRLKRLANKTKRLKGAIEFIVADSPVLTRILERRLSIETDCTKLLCTPDGKAVSQRMLSDRWTDARDAAAYRAEVMGNKELGATIRAMYLRDMRSFAADLAEDLDAASKLLDHNSKVTTRKHYRTKAQLLKTTR